MQITNKLKMDMTKSDPSLSVNVVQGDAYSRSLCIALYSGAVPWTIPDGVTVAVRYSKSDHTKGYYDTLPDGSSAWSVDDNILTVRLAPQMLTVPGKVIAQIEFVLGAHILSTFSLTVHVEPNPAAGVLKSEDYFNWLQWFQEQTDEHVSQIQKSILSANLAAQSAVQASEEAAASALKAESIAAGISVIVARNEAYTKQESDVRYSPSIFEVKTGTVLTLSDSASASFQLVKLFGKKMTYVAAIAASLICPIVNTGVFLLGCMLFFIETVAEWANAAGFAGNVGKYMIVGLVGFNFVFELGTNIVLSPVVLRLLNVWRKNK